MKLNTYKSQTKKIEVLIPWRHGYHLVCLYLHISLATSCILGKDNIHDIKKLLNALVLAQILTAFHQKWVVPLIISSDNNTLGFSDGTHSFNLTFKLRVIYS